MKFKLLNYIVEKTDKSEQDIQTNFAALWKKILLRLTKNKFITFLSGSLVCEDNTSTSLSSASCQFRVSQIIPCTSEGSEIVSISLSIRIDYRKEKYFLVYLFVLCLSSNFKIKIFKGIRPTIYNTFFVVFFWNSNFSVYIYLPGFAT